MNTNHLRQQIAVLPVEQFAALLADAAEQGATKAIEQYKAMMDTEDPEELVNYASIAAEYGIHVNTVGRKVKERFIETYNDPNNGKCLAIKRRHVMDIFKPVSKK